MVRLSLLTFLTLLALPLGAATPGPDPNAPIRESLQAELEDFSLPGWNRRPEILPSPPGPGPFVPPVGPALTEYRNRLATLGRWGSGPVWHQAGYLLTPRGLKLGINVFFPPGPSQGTLLFVHGYMSHAANFAYTHSFFLSRGWTVVTLDLPGHGLSSGPRGDVDSFADYGDAVTQWLGWEEKQGWPGPRVLMAHSLGSAAVFEALRRPHSPQLDRVVFCAPLLRTDWFALLGVGEATLGWWLKDLPTTFGWDGYLDGYVMPVHWVRALEQWLGSLDRQGPLALPLTIYSGDRDEVVDEGWNRAQYRRLVPGAPWVTLPGKGHLFLTKKRDQQEFLQRLWEDLGY